MVDDNLLYFDTGALINILATDHAVDILQTLPYKCAITEEIRNTSLLLWNNSTLDEQLGERKQASVAALTSHNLMEVHRHEKQQHAATYIQFARYMPVKQASLLTLVVVKGAALVSDDKRTRNVLSSYAPSLRILSTLTLLRSWQEECGLTDNAVRPAA